jgi:hypothetical protein
MNAMKSLIDPRDKDLLTVAQVAAHFKRDKRTVRTWMNRATGRRLESRWLGDRQVTSWAAIEVFMSQGEEAHDESAYLAAMQQLKELHPVA